MNSVIRTNILTSRLSEALTNERERDKLRSVFRNVAVAGYMLTFDANKAERSFR